MSTPLELLFKIVHGAKMKPFKGIPGPAPKYPFGTVRDFFGQKPWEVCAEYGETYGGITQIWLGSIPALVINDPNLIEEVMFSKQDNFYKDVLDKAARPPPPMMTEDSAFIRRDQDDRWAYLIENHPLSMSYFHEWLADQIPILSQQITTYAGGLVQRSQSGSFPFFEAIQRLACDSFSLATVGQELGDSAFDAFETMSKVADLRLKAPFDYPDNPRGERYQAASDLWFSHFEALVQQAHDRPKGPDLLSRMIYDGGSDLKDQNLSNVFGEIYFSGAFSTPSGIANTLYLLNQNPDWLAQLTDCLKSLPLDALTLDDLAHCELLSQCVLESLRMLPPVAFWLRNVVQDHDISFAGHQIPANTAIMMNNWYLHYLADHWPEPNRFNPARWDAQTRAENPLGGDYFFPFGRGARACLGQHFALFLIKLTLVRLVSQTRVNFDDPSAYQDEFYVGARVPYGLNSVWTAT